jgi:sulfur-carrier protein
MNSVTIRLFGAFRSHSTSSELRVEITPDATISEAKAALARLLPRSAELIESSALADETRILGPTDRIPSGARLAILPPVCGG